MKFVCGLFFSFLEKKSGEFDLLPNIGCLYNDIGRIGREK